MNRFLREPLLHFLLIGALLFLVHGLLSRGGGLETGDIFVSQAKIEGFAGMFERTWQRRPSDVELKGLIDNYVREEVLYREGVALGLDRDDPTIRRRVAQKLEFIGDSSASVEPTENELRAYFDSHRDNFRSEPRFTFRHIFLDPKRRQGTLVDDFVVMLEALNDGVLKAETLGDTTMLPLNFEHAPASDVKAVLGNEMAMVLRELPLGRWAGPVRSDFGMHLVQIEARTVSSDTAFADVRNLVKREWERDRRLKAADDFYAKLLRRYTITVEPSQFAMGSQQPSRP